MTRQSERGEGKIGSIVMLVLIGAVVAAGLKAWPVYYNANELVDYASNVGLGTVRSSEDVLKLMQAKARELEIQEALNATAIQTTFSMTDTTSGSASISFNFKIPINFYGIYTYQYEVKKRVARQILRG